MKKILVAAVIITATLGNACSDGRNDYIDLRTGKSVKIEKDPVTGSWLNAETKEPLYIYVDRKSSDTLYGKTGAVINGHVVKKGDEYWYDEDIPWDDKVDDDDSKYKTDTYKEKVDEDGDIKIKDDKAGTKTKTDGETRETKVKSN